MRPLSTLKANVQFKLSREDRKSGFVALYNGQVGMSPYDFMFDLTTRLIWPWSEKNDKVDAKTRKQYLNNYVKDEKRRHVVNSVIRRNPLTKSIEFKTPIFHTMAGAEEYLLGPAGSFSYKCDIPASTEEQRKQITDSIKSIEDTVFAGGRILSGEQVITMTKMTGRAAEILKHCLVQVEAVVENGYFSVYATWRMNQREAEYLNNVPFIQINLGNLYTTLVEWSATCIGKDGKLPDTICPISDIVNNVEAVKAQAPVPPRVGVMGIVVDVNRHYYVIPDLNNAREYEQQLLDFGMQEDGSYTWANNQARGEQDADGTMQVVGRKKLPVNKPIYADWLNDKFVYSNSVGNLSIYDLSNTVPCGSYHIANLLNTSVFLDGVSRPNTLWQSFCTAIALAENFDKSIFRERPVGDELPANAVQDLNNRTIENFNQAVMLAANAYRKAGGSDEIFFAGESEQVLRLYQLSEHKAFNWLFRMIVKANNALKANVEVAFTRYSVLNILQQMAVLGLVVEFAPKAREVFTQDEQERDNYINQGVDPNHPVEGIPNIKKGLKYQPHQAKIANIMRRGPKFAIFPVDAGGGKTITILTNTLLEIKKGHCKRPIIMCPAHLVGQYVKEVVFVTEGRINLIPITNSSFKAHGEEKLKKFIENAPRNTIVVTDFNFLKGRRQRVAYGNKTVDIYRNAEFMRQFEFDLVSIDESHYLKNMRSARRDAAARFMQDIPMKRIASGTLISDTMLDLVSQIALIDPTIFGSEDLFKSEYAMDMRGNKVMGWKPGAEAIVRKKIAEHCVVAGARRKEWAALLPPKKERFIGVEMTKNQRLLYESILKETMELINEAMAKDAEVRELMESEDDSKAEELEAKLRPYMARLERYMSAPEADPAAQLFLKDEDDLTSPKVKKVYEICREHINNNLPGKILIFTQYTASAESLAKNAPADLKPYFIHYTAGQKAECKAEFENNPKKLIMAGVSSSMDTGLNLQFASRLIRMETVWTPGVLEQGNSRINRPELKQAENRNMIYFDWLVINKSIDITKVARLVSKLISKAKFDNYDNPAYDAIENPPQVAMTLESIAANNDFTEELLPYLEAYQDYQRIEEEDYANYRAEQGDKLIAQEIPQEGLLDGSKLMSRVPYVPEMELYGVDKLGLVRYDHFVRQDFSELEEDVESDADDEPTDESEDDSDVVVVDPKTAKLQAARAAVRRERTLVKGMGVHTDFGDGVIKTVNRNYAVIILSNGQLIKLRKMQVYIITRSTTNGIDMRNELLKQVGKIPLDAPITVPVEEGVQDKKRKLKGRIEKDAPEEPIGPSAEFDFTVINDFLGLMYRGDAKDATGAILANYGFRTVPHYNYVIIKGPIVMLRFMKALHAAGFKLSTANSEELKRIYMALKVDKMARTTVGFATKMKISNFYREQLKPSSSQELLKIYPLVQDKKLYLLFPTKGQPANVKARRVQVSELTWKTSGDDELVRLFSTKQEAKDAIAELREAGVVIPESNLKELGEQFKSIRVVVR